MKLYYSKGACSLAVRIAIHEMNVSCDFEAVDLKTKKTETDADFLAINPKGAVPTLVLDNQQVLTENAVIQQYLADTYHATDMLPSLNDFNRYHVLEWLNFVSTDMHKGFSPLFNTAVPNEIKDNVFKPAIKNKLDFIDTHLAKNRFLSGEKFTLPDGYMFVILSWLPHFNMDISAWPNVARYFDEIKQRKSVEQSLKEEGITLR